MKDTAIFLIYIANESLSRSKNIFIHTYELVASNCLLSIAHHIPSKPHQGPGKKVAKLCGAIIATRENSSFHFQAFSSRPSRMKKRSDLALDFLFLHKPVLTEYANVCGRNAI